MNRSELEGLDPLQVYQATVMLLSGEPTQPVDALFFHGRSFGDTTNLFELAADFYRRGRTRFIALFNNEGERPGTTLPHQTNEGITWFRKQLVNNGVNQQQIISSRQGGYNTKMENNEFLDLSRDEGWTSAVIMTQPHQLLRAMLGMVRTIRDRNYWMNIWTLAPHLTPWYESVSGSQGFQSKPRIDHIADELIRIPQYQRQEDLASFEELFDYLKRRDNP